jgi:selenide,water dikinase
MVDFSDKIDPIIRDILFDPQTSGGLLFSLSEHHIARALTDLHEKGCEDAVVIGRVIADSSESVFVMP